MMSITRLLSPVNTTVKCDLRWLARCLSGDVYCGRDGEAVWEVMERRFVHEASAVNPSVSLSDCLSVGSDRVGLGSVGRSASLVQAAASWCFLSASAQRIPLPAEERTAAWRHTEQQEAAEWDTIRHSLSSFVLIWFHSIFFVCCWFCFSPMMLCQTKVLTLTQVITAVCTWPFIANANSYGFSPCLLL